MGVYKEPLYYEIAFGFIDAKKQADLFEKFIRKYSRIPIRRILDIGCGPSLQLREIARRGYEAVGLDASPRMLKYLEARAREEGVRIETVRADMTGFRLKKKADLACLLMGTVSCIPNDEKLFSHLDSVACSLKRGGLYLIECFSLDWAGRGFFRPGRWTRRRNGVRVRTTYHIELKDALTQTVSDTLTLEVEDRGRRSVFRERHFRKLTFPQEFLTLIRLNGRFEFIGWFERHSLRRLTKARMDNLAVLRRK